MEVMLTDVGCSSLGNKLLHVMAIITHIPRELDKNFDFHGLEIKPESRILFKATKLENIVYSYIPLGRDQALQPKPTRVWSFPNLGDPKAMSFYVKHVNHVRKE
jgi:hypothetical protein